MCVCVHLHVAYQELEASEARVRKVWMGAVSPPTGIAALKLVGSYLTSTWISFVSRSEGEESPREGEALQLFWRKRL